MRIRWHERIVAGCTISETNRIERRSLFSTERELQMKRISRTMVVMVMVAGLVAAFGMSALAAHETDKQVGGRPLSAALTGAAEVGEGDPDGMGIGAITVNIGQGIICYDVSAMNIGTVTGVHIHEAPVGVDGPVVVGLSFGSGCVTVERDLAKDILKNPSDYYINVHTEAFPAGAIRGQLSK
jgi:hypothetical protein